MEAASRLESEKASWARATELIIGPYPVVDRCAGALRLKPDRGSLCEGTKGLLRGRGGGGEKCDLCVLDGVAVGRVEDEVGMVR
jgi:hypothetical protein